MRTIQLIIPRDQLQALLDGKQALIPFNTDELGFPLRLHVYTQQRKVPGFFADPVTHKEEEDEDGN